MRKLKNLLTRTGIRQQLYFTYFTAMVVPIIIVGFLLCGNTYRILVDYHSDLLESDNQRVRSILYEITAQIYNISEDITFSEEIQGLLGGRYGETEWYYEAVDAVGIMDSYEAYYTEINDIRIYTDNPYAQNYKQFERITPEIRENDWYKKATGQSAAFFREIVRVDEKGNAYWNLCLIRKIPVINTRYNAVMVIRISDDYLRSRIDTSGYENMVSVGEGAICYCSDRKKYGKPVPVTIDRNEPYYQYVGRQTMNNKRSFVSISTLHPYQSENKIYITTINDKGFEEIQGILFICVGILLFTIIIPIFLIYFFTNYFTERVNVLRGEMHKASMQDYELLPEFSGHDELAEVFEDLQIMVKNIKEQEAKSYLAQINEKELLIQQQSMELKMLSSQINPHFLYNTLETIRMKAFVSGDREVATAIKLLGKSMRHVLDNTGTAFTTLGEELAHVETYIRIQKLRFGDRINYQVNTEDEDIKKYAILPLLLQPIVENSIIHGLWGDEREGHIAINIFRDNVNALLVIEIRDNGEGIDGEALKKLKYDIEHSEVGRTGSIGLYNINRRVKLHYGEEYGIKIRSKTGEGTAVILTIPLEILKNDSNLI